MSCFTDIKLTGVLFRIFQSNLYGTAHIGYTVASDDDKVPMTAPAFGISWKFDGNDLGIGRFDCFVSRIDLSGSTGTGTQQSQTFVRLVNLHLLKQCVIDARDYKSDSIQYGCPDKFCHGTVHGYFLNFVDI